jgi:hypothetical protein
MKTLSIDEINKLYQCTKDCRLYKHLVHHTAFRDFCMAMRDLENSLAERAEDTYWQGLLRELRRFRFIHYAAPVPVNYHAIELLRFLEEQKKDCRLFFPGFLPRLEGVIGRVSNIVAVSANPIVEKILEITTPGNSLKTALLLKETYLHPPVEELLGDLLSLNQVELVNRYQLRGAQRFQRLFVIGPHYWFPDYIFRAPRAEEVHYIRYGWIQDTWMVPPIFIRPTHSQNTAEDISSTRDIGNTAREWTDEDQGQAEIPEINWQRLSTKVMRAMADDRTQEIVPARLYLLASHHAVLLEASEHARVLAVDLETGGEDDDEEETQQIRRIPVAKLQPGMFLLLRTEGGGDYIVPIADKILGEDAAQLRQAQEQWKSRLRREVEEKELLDVCIALLDLGGSKHVSEINLRYWMSSKCIRPQDDNDFKAILKLVGLADKETFYRDVADRIENAHRRAGFYIRKLLISQVATADLHEIHKRGYMEFELPRSDGGSLTAFRIEGISPTTTPVSASRIGRPVPARDY